MAGEERKVDGETGRGQRLGQRSQGLGIPGETVEDEHAVRATLGRPGLGARDDRSSHDTGCYPSLPGQTASGPRRAIRVRLVWSPI